MTDAQAKIDIERDGGLILGAIIRYQHGTDGLLWTTKMLAHTLNVSIARISNSCTWLVKNGYMVIHRGEYIVTDAGRDYYDTAATRPQLNTGTASQRFKVEALTGITETRNKNGHIVTTQSGLSNCAVPRSSVDFRNDKTPEMIISEIQEKRRALKKIATKLGIDFDDIAIAIERGDVGVCTVCNDVAIIKDDVCKKCKKGKE